ncbi:MAG: adenylosuccinate lyase [Bacteroidota bacterium]|jgi:adenylosuccinate lyase
MPVHLIDSPLLGDRVSTPEMRAIFEADSQYQAWLDVEAALAEAQAEVGMVPAEAARAIRAAARIGNLDLEKVKEHGRVTGHPLLGIVRELRDKTLEPHGTWAHYGATTQDIIDSGHMLLAKRAHALIDAKLGAILSDALPLLEAHRDTLAVARTHGLHALPYTFGFKVASWLEELARNRERWQDAERRCLVGSICGAVGTYAPWGQLGFEVQDRTCRRLGLSAPRMSWQSQRDRVAELGAVMALIAGTAARIAGEIYQMNKTEVGELAEPYRKGLMGSSTMPHKVNPGKCEWLIAVARIVRNNAAVLLECMDVEDERDTTVWRTEWVKVPESFCFLSGALEHLHQLLAGLQVNTARMRQNLDMLQGVLLSERAMFLLQRAMPLGHAHDVVHEASLAALAANRPLADVLLEDEHVKGRFTRAEIEEALRPEAYIGLSREVVDRIAGDIRAGLGARPG